MVAAVGEGLPGIFRMMSYVKEGSLLLGIFISFNGWLGG